MSRFKLAVVAALFVGASTLAAAQPKPSVPSVSGPGASIHALNERLRSDMMQIQKDLKAGKITKAQAEDARAKVRAVRKQELADFKANGNKTLTDAQVSALNSQLDQVNSSL